MYTFLHLSHSSRDSRDICVSGVTRVLVENKSIGAISQQSSYISVYDIRLYVNFEKKIPENKYS